MEHPAFGPDHSDHSDRYRIETPEQIGLEFDIAGHGSRFLAALADLFILQLATTIFFCVGFFGLGAFAAALEDSGEAAFYIAIAILLLLTFSIFWGYFVFFETIWQGQTPGKRMNGLRVIQEGGYPIGFSQAAIRNLVRVLDFLPYGYMIGATVMLFDRRFRRLGDLLAGTIVIKEHRDVKLETLGLNATWLPAVPDSGMSPVAVPNLHRLTPADQSLIMEYFSRRPMLTTEAAGRLSLRLATVFARKLEYTPSGDVPEVFLARIARDLRGQQPSIAQPVRLS